MNRHVGFSGTQLGMTSAQIWEVDKLLFHDLITSTGHHGDCIGADADFHTLARLNGMRLHGHPPLNPKKRAFCQFDSMEEEKEYIERNHDIVKAVDWMIFTPAEYKEQLRSGTWSTIRYTRNLERDGFIVWPDGKVTDVNESY